MTDAPKHAGTEIAMGGTKWIVPPLNLRLIREHREKIKSLKVGLTAQDGGLDQMEIMLDIIHGAMLRNYPNVTRPEVEEMVDVVNVGAIMQAILNMSGLVPRASPPGEAVAGETS